MPNIGEPIPTPRVKRDRPRDPEAMRAVEALLNSPEGTSVPVNGFADEDEARRYGGKVQGYVARDHELTVRTHYNRHDAVLILTLEHSTDDGEET